MATTYFKVLYGHTPEGSRGQSYILLEHQFNLQLSNMTPAEPTSVLSDFLAICWLHKQ